VVGMTGLENKCLKPNGQKMHECSVANAGLDFQKQCKHFDKATRASRCMYIMKFDDFHHCGCCKAQMEAS
jgi:hypothetical protein